MPIVDPYDTAEIIDPLDAQAPVVGPELRQGTNPTIVQRVMSLFKDSDKEGAIAVQALVDSKALGISPSQAHRYRKQIDQGAKINPAAASLRSSFGDRVKQSFDTGVTQNRIGEIGYKFVMTGDPKYLTAIEAEKIPTEGETFISEGRLESAIRSAAKMLPMMGDALMEGSSKGLTLGMSFGGAAALLGQAGPQIAFPEEAITVPAATLLGFKIGAADGAFEASLRKESGLAVSEIIKFEDEEGNRIDPNIARAAAFGIGAINAGIEVAQISTLLKTIPGADKFLSAAIMEAITSKTIKQKLMSLAGKYSKTVATETGQELAQESTNIVFEEVSKKVNNKLEGTDIKPAEVSTILARLKETAIESAQGFAVLSLPGNVMSAAGLLKKDGTSKVDTQIPNETVQSRLPASIQAQRAALSAEATTMEAEQTRLAAEVPAMDEQSFDETIDAIFSGERNLEEMIIEDIEDQPEETAQVETAAPVQLYRGDSVNPDGIGQGSQGDLGKGIYFTDSSVSAEYFTDGSDTTHTRQFPVKIEKPFDINDPALGETPEWKSMVDTLPIDPQYGVKNRDNLEKWARGELDVKNNYGFLARSFGQDVDTFNDFLAKYGYDSVVDRGVRGVSEGDKQYVVFDKSKVVQDSLPAPVKAPAPEQIIADNIKVLADTIAETGEATIEPVMELGRVAFEEGSTLETFTDRMKEIAGELWEKVKTFVAEIFEKLKEERGSFSIKDVKPKVREVTGQNKPAELREMAEEYKKAERYSKIGFREGIKAGVEQANAPKQESVKGRVRRITGQTSIVDMVREDEALRAAFKKAEQAGRIAYREGNKAGVAEQKAIIKELIAKTRAQAIATKETNKDIKAIKKLAKVGKGVDVEFQRQIKAAVENLDFTKLSEGKIEELNELQKLIDESGSTIGIPAKRIEEISRLAKTPIRDMTPENIKELRDQLEHLVEVGKMLAEMKYQYKEAARLEKLDEVILTTNNIDPDVKLSEDRMRDKIKIAGTVFYTDTLHTPRVAELADNFKKGPQQEFIRRIGEAESQLTAKALQREITFLEGMKAAGLEVIEEGSGSDIKMMIVMRYREGATTQAETLMNHYGYNTVPTLNEQEEKILSLIQEDMQANKAGLAAVFEEIEQEIFPEQEVYYLPLKYEKEEEIVPDTQVQGRGRTTHTFDGFKNKRRAGVSKLPRVGVLQIYKEAVLEQEWYKGIQPVIQDIKSVVLTEEYKEAAGSVLYNWWKDEIDIVARRGWSASASMNAASSLMRRVRHNLNTAILGFKASTIIMQPMAVFDAMAYTNAKLGPVAAGKVLSEVIKSFVIPGRTKGIVAGSDSLKQRQGGELAITEELLKAKGETVKDKFTRTAFKFISQADLKTAAGVQEAIRKIMIKSGMSEEEALKEAEFTMKLSQGDSSIAYRPHILSQGEGARTWFTFQTFVMNRWGIIVHDLIAGKITHGTAKERMAGLISIGILIMAGATEDEAREWLYELVSAKKMKADNRSTAEKVFVDLSSTMPFFGSFINAASSGMDASPPVLRTLQQGVKGIDNTFTGKDADKRFKGLMKSVETGLIIGVGFPGTAQFFDLLEGSITRSDRR